MTQLNSYIFNDICKYLIYKCSFNYILELSLISKSHFLIIRNLISHNNKENDIILSNYGFQNYLKRSINYSSKYYKRQLLQYKTIEYLYLDNEINDLDILNLIKLNCKKLKEIKIKNIKYAEYYQDLVKNSIINGGVENENNNFNFNFIYNKLLLYFDYHYYPTSDLNEYQLSDIDFYDIEISSNFEYSYQFLLKYKNVKKLIFSSRYTDNHVFQINNFNNFFKSSTSISTTIKSIEFKFHNTPITFLKELRSIKSNLESLEIRYDDHYVNQDIINTPDIYINELLLSLESFNNLKKLKINQGTDGFRILNGDHHQDYITKLINKLIDISSSSSSSNQDGINLNTLGLQLFDINNNENKLLPILKLKTISKLVCDHSDKIQFLKHIEINSNIKTLVIDYTDIYQFNLYSVIDFEPLINYLTQTKNNNIIKNLKIIILTNRLQSDIVFEKLKSFNMISIKIIDIE